MSLSLADFQSFCSTRGLLDEADVSSVVDGLSSPDVKQLATALVKQGRLTAYQAGEIFQGRGEGLLLGDYVLLEKLGAGGMGEVYKAQHRTMTRIVAIKILPRTVSKNADAVRRFQREVVAVARLSHPHIVQAYDAGEQDGVHYLVMEYVDGGDLATLVKRRGPLKVDHALHCLMQAALGLAHAHEEGVIHRDIKPANLLLDKKGVVKVLDLGLARLDNPLTVADSGLTEPGAVMGTADYMSPEQALDTKHADVRSDIYSLGCTLFYLLTGERMYEGDTVMKKLIAHREAPIPSLQALLNEVPYDLDELFQRLVAKRPADRPQTMEEVHRLLSLSLPGADGSWQETSQSSIQSILDSELVTFLKRNPPSLLPQFSVEDAGRAPTISPHAGSDTHKKTHDLKPRLDVKPIPRPRSRRVRNTVPAAVAGAMLLLGGIAWYVGSRPPQPAAPVATAPPKSPTVAQKPVLPQTPPAAANAPFSTLQARAFQTAWAARSGVPMSARNSLGMKLLLIPPGHFLMGTTDEQLAVLRAQVLEADPTVSEEKFAEFRREQPPHEVTLTRPFYLAEHEVTLGQFRQFVEATGHRPDSEASGAKGWKGVKESVVFEAAFNWRNPGYDVTDRHPVGSVTWHDAVLFCNWLSRQEGLPVCYERHVTLGWMRSGTGGYRLPTEAEWEFACRAGTTALWPWGDSGYTAKGSSDEIQKFATIYRDERSGQMAPVGTMTPNAFGLYDMIGNAGEWCQDWYAVDYSQEAAAVTDPQGPKKASNRTYRGLASSGYYMRPAFRGGVSMPEHRIGFRVARDVDVSAARPAK